MQAVVLADVGPVHGKASDARHTHATKWPQLLGYEQTVTIREGVKQFVELYEATWIGTAHPPSGRTNQLGEGETNTK